MLLLLSYTPDQGPSWIRKRFQEAEDEDETISLKRTFSFQKQDLYVEPGAEVKPADTEQAPDEEEDDMEPTEIILGHLQEEYYKLNRRILGTEHDIFLHKDAKVDGKWFVSSQNISIFARFDRLVNADIYISGVHPNAIPEVVFKQLIAEFPGTVELRRYAAARVTTVIKEYVPLLKDFEEEYNRYMDKKASLTGENLEKIFKEYELEKYQNILAKLKKMLASEDGYTEKRWQQEILQILLLLNPRYIRAFSEVKIKGIETGEKRLDYLLVDANGYTDIVEIKKPMNKSIVSEKTYRNNFIPVKELSGTVMQLEKYLYCMNRWADQIEKSLTKRYQEELPENLKLKITNPRGIIMMGRENNLTEEQKADFEVIKRKYRNIADIVTYDNLMFRIDRIIEHIKRT